MSKQRHRRAWSAGLLALALIGTSCASDDANTATDADTNVTTAESVDAPSDSSDTSSDDGEAEGATLTVAAPGVVSSVDTERYQGFVSIDLLPSLVGVLVRFDTPTPGSSTLQPPDELVGELAESWELNDDRTQATFTLRDGVLSNLGNPLTSEDVRWSIERMVNSEGVPIAKIMMGIGGWDMDNPIEVIDERTFELNFAEPNAVSISILSNFFLAIYDSEAVLANAAADDPWGYNYLDTNTASFGAYEVASMDPGNEVVLRANPNYHRGMPDVTDVVIRSVADGSSRLQLAQTGEVDIAQAMTYDQIKTLQDDERVRLEEVLYPNIDAVIMNLAVAPFDDVRVRQAVAYALDRPAILEGAYSGIGTVSTDFFHDAFGADPLDAPLERDLDRSRELLAEAGLADGFDMTLAYNVPNLGAQVDQVGVLVRAQLAEVGINVELQNIPAAADFDAAKRDNTLSAWLATSLPLVPDPGYYLQVFYETGGLTNLHNYSSAQVDSLSRQILETQPGEDRQALLDEVNQFMMQDMPSAPIVDTKKFYVFNPSVTGFLSYPAGNIVYWDLSTE